jgi:hypothetical protein
MDKETIVLIVSSSVALVNPGKGGSIPNIWATFAAADLLQYDKLLEAQQ